MHDVLYARVLVLSDGVETAALACMDLVGLDFGIADAIRSQVNQRAAISTTLLNCSHTHSAPFTIPWSVQGWENLQRDRSAWLHELVAQVTHVIQHTAKNLKRVRLYAARAHARVGTHPRLPTRDRITMQPNLDGAVVAWVDVLCVRDEGDRPIAILFSHAAHLVIVHASSTCISADYPGAAVAKIRETLGGDVTAIFAQGCGGNINGEPLRGGFAAATKQGITLGEATLHAIEQAKPLTGTRLQVRSKTLALPFREPPSLTECETALQEAEDVLRDSEKVANSGEKNLWSTRERVLCLRDLLQRVKGKLLSPLRFDINVLRVGDMWSLVTMTHECFSEYPLWIQQDSSNPHTIVWAYTNGCESTRP